MGDGGFFGFGGVSGVVTKVEFDGFGGGGTFGFLLGVAGATAALFAGDENADGEGFVVIGASFAEDAIGGGGGVVVLGEFLKVGFGVAPAAVGEDLVDFD